MNIVQLAVVGGVFAVLVFIHFVVDWLFQTHDQAMAKATDALVRAKHCTVYTMGFVPLLWALHVPMVLAVLCIQILFWSHYLEDTYVPVYLWAKYVRKPKGVNFINAAVLNSTQGGLAPGYQTETFEYAKDILGFKTWMGTPLGAILGITVDQIIHLAFLLLVAFLLVMA
jgi:hypothetical protein